jgi:hypothetical protein
MNRCQKRVLLSFGISMTILAAFGITGAIVLAASIVAVVAILVATGLIATFIAFILAGEFINCRK